jgi:hypothetical protein
MFSGTVPFVTYGMYLSLVGLFHSYDSEKLKQTLWKEINSKDLFFLSIPQTNNPYTGLSD